MKFGVTIPNNWGVDNPQQVLAMGPLAEELGFDSIWVMDHLFNTGYIRERLEDRPYYHPLSTLSFLAATTTSLVNPCRSCSRDTVSARKSLIRSR